MPVPSPFHLNRYSGANIIASQEAMICHSLSNTCHVERVLSLNFGSGKMSSALTCQALCLYLTHLHRLLSFFTPPKAPVQQRIKSVINILGVPVSVEEHDRLTLKRFSSLSLAARQLTLAYSGDFQASLSYFAT